MTFRKCCEATQGSTKLKKGQKGICEGCTETKTIEAKNRCFTCQYGKT
jgi:hypothetical protein